MSFLTEGQVGVVLGTRLETGRPQSLRNETMWVPLDQSFSLRPKKKEIANHPKNVTKKTAGISPNSHQESTLTLKTHIHSFVTN